MIIIAAITSQLTTAQELRLNDLEGKWFINQSNFPMWLKGNKINPTFNYTLIEKNGKPNLLDEVQYSKKSKTKSIIGNDKPLNENNNSFVWRGKGLLAFVKSKWNILYINPEKQWMVIHFQKTLFTPEGYDVVSRSKTLEGELLIGVEQKLNELGITGLTTIHQE